MKRSVNPIFESELKERMRSLRAPFVLTAYLLVLGMILFATERLLGRNIGDGDPFGAAVLGRSVFHFMLFFTLMMICFLVPAFTASAISAERERQTFPLLQVTLMRPASIVLGKLGSSLAYLALLIVATLPLMGISLVLGGVTPLDILRGYAMVALTGFTLAMVGIGLSASLRRTVSSTVLTYAVVGALCVGTILGYGLLRVTYTNRGRDPSGHVWMLVLNPFVGTASAIQNSGGVGGSTPFDSVFNLLNERRFAVAQIVNDSGPNFVVRGGGPVPVAPALPPDVIVKPGVPFDFNAQPQAQPLAASKVPVWASTLGWYLGISALGFLLAVRGVRAPARGFGWRRRAAPPPEVAEA